MGNEVTLLEIQESTESDMAKALELIDTAMIEIDSIAEAVLESEHPSDGGDPKRLIDFGIAKEKCNASKFFNLYEDLENVWFPYHVERFAAPGTVFDIESSRRFVEDCLTVVKSDIASYYPHLVGGKPRRWQKSEILLAAQSAICSSALAGIVYSPCAPKQVGRSLFDIHMCFETAKSKLVAASYDEEVAMFQMRMMDSQRAAMDAQKDLMREQAHAAKRQTEIADESAKQSAEMLKQSTAMTDMTKIIEWCTIATLTVSALTLLVTLVTAAISNSDFLRAAFAAIARFVIDAM